ncbi:MAG: arsenate reductase family protein [Oscillospiraceae bacterium]|nr:arsenate reductase family protein [Oscillospiraceae bacterium]
MNLQIFGTKKCFDTKKAQRFFKERGIKFQFIDLNEKPMSKGEFNSVCAAAGGMEKLLKTDSDEYAQVKYLLPEAMTERILETPSLFRTPIVRDGKRATVGNCPEVWKQWLGG